VSRVVVLIHRSKFTPGGYPFVSGIDGSTVAQADPNSYAKALAIGRHPSG
jgi:hypothetical protein